MSMSHTAGSEHMVQGYPPSLSLSQMQSAKMWSPWTRESNDCFIQYRKSRLNLKLMNKVIWWNKFQDSI